MDFTVLILVLVACFIFKGVIRKAVVQLEDILHFGMTDTDIKMGKGRQRQMREIKTLASDGGIPTSHDIDKALGKIYTEGDAETVEVVKSKK